MILTTNFPTETYNNATAEPGLKGRTIPAVESETVAPIRYGPGSYDVAKRDWRDRRGPRSFGRKTGATVVVTMAVAKVKGGRDSAPLLKPAAGRRRVTMLRCRPRRWSTRGSMINTRRSRRKGCSPWFNVFTRMITMTAQAALEVSRCCAIDNENNYISLLIEHDNSHLTFFNDRDFCWYGNISHI